MKPYLPPQPSSFETMTSEEMIGELAKLVRIRSTVTVKDREVVRNSYGEAAEAVAELARRLGLEVEVLDLLDGEVPTIIASIPGEGPSLALISHYDVVPAGEKWVVDGLEMDPFDPQLVDGRLYGRGTADDKSAIVASLFALAELKGEGARLRYNPQVIVTGDEEVGGLGARALLGAGLKWDRVVILDARADYLSVGASGVVHGWIEVEGKAGHAGYPHEAENAVERLVELLHELISTYKPVRASKVSRYRSPPGSPLERVWGRFSVTILRLGPGEPAKHNIIPGLALAGFDIRLVPEEDYEEALAEFMSYFSRAVAKLGVRARLRITGGQRGWYSTDEEFVKEALSAVANAYRAVGEEWEPMTAAELGGNDGTFFFQRGMPVVSFGAMRPENRVHGEGEFVYTRDVVLLKEFVKYLLRA